MTSSSWRVNGPNKVNTLHTGLWAKPLWFFLELILGHPRSQCLRKSVQDWNVNKAKTLHTVLWAKPYGSSKKASRYSQNLLFQKTYHRLGKGPKQILCSLANEPNPMVLPRTHLGSSQNSKSEVICPGLEIQTKSYFAPWLMSQTPMVLPRTHLGSSQISMSEEISPRLEYEQS